MASQMDRITATGDVGTAAKATYLKSVALSAANAVTLDLRRGGSTGTIFMTIVLGAAGNVTWTAGDDKGVGCSGGLHATLSAAGNANIEYAQLG